MAELDLGRIRFFDKGEHSVGTEYVLWDFVEGDGSTYLYTNKTGSTGKALTNSAYWKKLASGLTEAEINAVLIATQEASTATTQANDARDRAIATTDETVIAKNATIQATEDANIATGLANDAVTEINETVIPNAETATQDAIGAKDDYYDVVKPDIIAQGNLAQEQGEFAQQKGSELTLDLAVVKREVKQNQAILSTINSNQEAKQSIEGTSPLNLPINAGEGNAQFNLKGLTATNLIVNGDFRDGTTGWGVSGINITTNGGFLTVNHSLSATATVDIYRASTGINVGDKIYTAYNTNHSEYLLTRLFIYDTGTFLNGQLLTVTNAKISKASYIATSTKNNPRFTVIITALNKATDVMSIGNIILINLTQTFGAGNEPTKEWCDEHFANYFEGTQSVDAPIRIKSVSQDGLKQSNLYIDNNTKLRGLPNGVKDEIRSDGKGGYEMVKRVGKYTIKESDFIYMGDSYDNVDYLLFYKPLDMNKLSFTGDFILENKPYADFNWTDINKIGKSAHWSNDRIAIGFTKGTTFANAKLASIGLTLTYQLETPIITPLITSGSLISRPNGTVSVEQIVANAGVYTDKYDVTIPTLEIKAIESITKIDFETAQETKLNVDEAVISDSSFTHPNLANGDIVFVVYEYQNDSLNAPLKVDYYDSRYTVKDSVTDTFYKWSITVADGVPIINLIEA